METLDSMSEQDINDITNIAKIVEPHLDLPQEAPQPEVKAETKAQESKPQVSSNDLETFQNFIGSISEKIDSLLQKIQASKECSEYFNIKWMSKITFGNMKRQIHQLKINRLAQKLSKKDLSTDEEELIKSLQRFLTDLTTHNNEFTIEDNFGLPTTHALEQKYLKKTHVLTTMLDQYIDILMPQLEKFLRKWDPEALAMAKESVEKSKTANKHATDATKVIPQAEARVAPLNQSNAMTGGNYNKDGANYYPTDAYPIEYGLNGPNGFSPYGHNQDHANSPKGKQAKAADKNQTPTQQNIDAQKSSLSNYDYVANELNEHLQDKFDAQHEESFVNFLKDIANKYPEASPTPKTKAHAVIDQPSELAWLENDFKNYTSKVKETFKNTFSHEFEELTNVASATKKKIIDMTSEELNKLQNNSDLAAIERRINRYKAEFENIEPSINTAQNSQSPVFANFGQKYTSAHHEFITYINDKIGDELKTLTMDIENLRRKAKRTASSLKTAAKKQTAFGQSRPQAIPVAA